MIVVETKMMSDNLRMRRRHCFRCGLEAVGYESVEFVGKRPHPTAFGKIYGVNKKQLNLL